MLKLAAASGKQEFLNSYSIFINCTTTFLKFLEIYLYFNLAVNGTAGVLIVFGK